MANSPEDHEALAFFDGLAGRAGTPALTANEVALVLDLAREVAHHHERRFAPLSAYAAGLMLSTVDQGDREERLEALVALVRELP